MRVLIKSATFFILMIFSLSGFTKPAKILVIESYHAEYKWDIEYKKALKDYLGKEHQLHYFQMDTKRVPASQFQYRSDLAWQAYLELQPDVVILGDDNALKYLAARFGKTTTPVVYLGINNNPRNYPLGNAKNITGVLERPLIKRSVMTIGSVIPKMSRLLILFDSGVTAHTSLENIFDNESVTTISNIQVEIKLIKEWEIWQSQVNNSPANYDAIIVGLYHTIRDKDNNYVDAEKVLQWTSKNSPLPMFALWDFAVGKDKAIGGLVLQAYHQGAAAANLVLKILAGYPPEKLRPITAVNGTYLFSHSELNKSNIQLPDHIWASAIWVE
ncbi:ABC transporter substrate-binding protein [Thalassotalea sp. PLHSN55]|uniref:ABC transporter substrate-binding protein n=1 Tax=Thalassotalea sp. PLHSN55 TaxID=3435888 RepID=UPI003F84CA70